MKRTSWNAIILAAAAAALLGGGAGYWYAKQSFIAASGRESSQMSEEGPTARVQVAPLSLETIEERLTAYGGVTALPEATQTFSVPFECVVNRVLAAPGQVVEAGTPLMEIEPSPDARLQLEETLDELATARKELKLLKKRLELKLATLQDLAQAEQQVSAAELRKASLEKRGVDGPQTIKADAPGTVSRIGAAVGQIVPAGGMLAETVGGQKIQVQVGIESEDLPHLTEGQPVDLYPVNSLGARKIAGHIRLITRRVNPETRLVDVYVEPEAGAELILNEYVRAELTAVSRRALTAPRSAALPEDGSYVLYTIREGRAVRHVVRIGIENDARVEVIGEGLEEGQPAVVTGNAELEDGMAVKVEKAR